MLSSELETSTDWTKPAADLMWNKTTVYPLRAAPASKLQSADNKTEVIPPNWVADITVVLLMGTPNSDFFRPLLFSHAGAISARDRTHIT